MIENQNIEFKSSWHDDILKTICSLAKDFISVKSSENRRIKYTLNIM